MARTRRRDPRRVYSLELLYELFSRQLLLLRHHGIRCGLRRPRLLLLFCHHGLCAADGARLRRALGGGGQ